MGVSLDRWYNSSGRRLASLGIGSALGGNSPVAIGSVLRWVPLLAAYVAVAIEAFTSNFLFAGTQGPVAAGTRMAFPWSKACRLGLMLIPLLGALLAGSLATQAQPTFAKPSLRMAAEPEKTPQEPKEQPLTPEDLRQRLKDVVGQIARTNNLTVPSGVSAEDRAGRLRALKLLSYAYQRHLNALAELTEQLRQASTAEERRVAWKGFEQPPPYSALIVDRLRADLQNRMLESRGASAEKKLLEAEMQLAEGRLQKAREASRLAQDALDVGNEKDRPVRAWRRDRTMLEEKAFAAYLSALLASRDVVELKVAESAKAEAFARHLVEIAEKTVSFSAKDLETLLANIEMRRAKMLNDLDLAITERDRVADAVATADKRVIGGRKAVGALEAEILEVRAAVQRAKAGVERAENSPGLLNKLNPFRGKSEKEELARQQTRLSELEAKLPRARAELRKREQEAQLSMAQSRNTSIAVERLNTQRVLLDMQQALWESRYAAWSDKGQPGVEARKQQTDILQWKLTLDSLNGQIRSQLELTLDQLAELQGVAGERGTDAESAFRQDLSEVLAERERGYLLAFSQIDEVRQLLERWTEDSESAERNLGPRERVWHWLHRVGEIALGIWQYEFFVVEDTIEIDGKQLTGRRGITVGKVVHALALLVLGYFLVMLVTRYGMRLALRWWQVDPVQAQIALKWLRVLAMVILLLMAMMVVKIPVTAFAFLGGAIAIGAGFGMQTLLKNLISGIMLLIERPFRPRDLVEVGSIRGEITDINIRSCTIRDVNGIETLVPNSTFLEQNVTNWTLSSHRVRYSVRIGVAYGSSVQDVSRLLREVAAGCEAVLTEPVPEVLFEDFGDSALIFSLNVWLDIGPGQPAARVVLSDLRFMIDASFAQHGISIPFPQRDVHVDASAPIPVRVVDDSAGHDNGDPRHQQQD